MYPKKASNRRLKDGYNRLLETLSNVVTSTAAGILRGVLEEVMKWIFEEMEEELRVYLMRIAEKIIGIC